MNDKLAYEKNKRRIFMSKYEQAIKLLEMLSSDEFQQFTSSEFDDAIYTAIEALEKADKYRWHDLRKNPDDLPEADGNSESEYVLVMIGTPEWNSWEQAYYHHGKRLWTTYEQNVFAWRYIEPFKEEADEE